MEIIPLTVALTLHITNFHARVSDYLYISVQNRTSVQWGE